MNHASIIKHEAERAYRQRAYVLADIDQRHFDALNHDDHVLGLNGYCIDALDYMPAGGMQADTPVPVFHARSHGERGRQSECVRGMTISDIRERETLAARLIAEIIGTD
jgi:hypothetical protein